MWGKQKKEMEEIINEFKYIQIPKTPLTTFSTPGGPDPLLSKLNFILIQ